jgi:DNA-binding MltR family transcriptional regulator
VYRNDIVAKKRRDTLGPIASMDLSSKTPFEELKALYTKETDRGAALLAGAYADTALEVILRRCMVQDDAAQEEIDELFTDSGPLGTFSAKIRMVLALGILPAVFCRDLNLVRQIRNDFAHHAGEVTFETPSIRSRCEATITGTHVRTLERESGRADPHWTARNLYLNAVALGVAMAYSNIEERQPPEARRVELSIPPVGPTRRRRG